MGVELQLLWIGAVALGLCLYAGWGAVRLALPEAWQPLAGLLALPVGYALLIWCGYTSVSTALDLRWSLVVALVLATLLNLLALRLGHRPAFWRPLRDHALAWVIVALTLLAGVYPLVQYGYPTIIGQGWDTESYLPMAQHLVHYPLSQIPTALPNPLRDLVVDPPRIGLTLGFSVFQGMLMIASNQTALDTFAPAVAFLRALGMLGVYAWLLSSMGLRRGFAAVATALTSAGALLLWIGYFNFGMQMAAWPLMACGLALGLAAVEDLGRRGWRALPFVLLTALVLAGLPIAYYPALTVWVPMAAALGAVRMLEARRSGMLPGVVRLLGAALLLAALTLLLAANTVVDYFEGFSWRYSLIEPKIGPDRFLAATDILGLTAFRLPGGGDQPPDLLVWVALALTGLLALLGLLLAQRHTSVAAEMWRTRWLVLVLAVLSYLIWLRFGRPYEYGFMKGSAYVAVTAWGLAMLGAQALWDRWQVPVVRVVPVLALLPALIACGWSQVLVIDEHARGPAIMTRGVAAFQQPAAAIPPGARVLVSSDETFTGPIAGMFSTMLYGREIWGHLVTAYTGTDRWPAGGTPEYVLLAAAEHPWPLRFGAEELWRSDRAALFRMPADRGLLLGRERLYDSIPPDDSGSPAQLAIWRQAGTNRLVTPEQPLRIEVDALLRLEGLPASGPQVPRVVRLQLAAPAEQIATLRIGTTELSLALRGGLNLVDVRVPSPATLVLVPSEALAFVSAQCLPPDELSGSAPARTRLDVRQALWSAQTQQADSQITSAIRLINPGRHALRMEVQVVEDTFEGARRVANVLAAAPIEGEWRLALDLARGASEARIDGVPVPMLRADLAPTLPDGRFFGVLTIYDGEEVVARAPLFVLEAQGGRIAAFQPQSFSFEPISVGRLEPPFTANQRDLTGLLERVPAGAPMVLEQGVLLRTPAAPGAAFDAPFTAGDALRMRLAWRADQSVPTPLMVSVQVLGANDRKIAQWDGPVGGDWRPLPLWQPGERMRQDVPLMLDPTAPPGTYRLILVIYDLTTGTPLPFGTEQSLSLGEIQVVAAGTQN